MPELFWVVVVVVAIAVLLLIALTAVMKRRRDARLQSFSMVISPPRCGRFK